MSRDLNKVILIGRLGRDPEMRYTPSGRPVTTFSLSTTRTWNTAEGEKRTETEWFNIVAWSTLAEICNQYLSKGRQVYVEGRIQTRNWEDQEGNKNQTVEVIASEMIMLGDRKQNNGQTHVAEEQEEFPF